MKKQILKSALMAMAGVGLLAGGAMAVPMTWVDVVDPSPDVKVPPSYTLTHDISDPASGSFSSWFMGGNDTIDSFNFTVELYDDNQDSTKKQIVDWYWIFPVFGNVTVPDGGEEGAAGIGVGGLLGSYDLTMGTNSFDVAWQNNFSATLDLYSNGIIQLKISATDGDFYFDKSTLTVHGDNGTAPVPEPATMLLFGTGLAGLAAVARRRKTQG